MSYGWGDFVADVGTGGLYSAGKYVYNKAYKDPAEEQKKGYYGAGDSAATLGSNMQKYYQDQGQQALGYFSGAPQPGSTNQYLAAGGYDYNAAHGGTPTATTLANQPLSPDQALINQANNRPMQQQDYFNYMKGQAGGLTNQEELYNERKNGTDPAAAYMDKRAIDQINNQLAARGRYNSGPGVRQISDYEANANAQRSQQLASLAGGADSSRLGLDSAYGNAASGASGEQSGYFNDLEHNSQSLAQAKADTFGHYSDEAGQAYTQGQLAKIEAYLAAQGVDAATFHQLMTDLGSVGGGAAKLTTAAKS